MSDLLQDALLCGLGLGIFVFFLWLFLFSPWGEYKTESRAASPHLARVEAEVGKTTLTLTRGGEPIAVVVLTGITRSFDGTVVEFRDLAHFMQNYRHE